LKRFNPDACFGTFGILPISTGHPGDKLLNRLPTHRLSPAGDGDRHGKEKPMMRNMGF